LQKNILNQASSANSAYHQLILDNIVKTKSFLISNFKNFTGGQFVKTKVISIKLQQLAEEISENNVKILGTGRIKFLMGEAYNVTEEQLNQLKTSTANNVTESEKILNSSNFILGADGAHSRVRAQIFDDKEPEKDVIQHLVEIKLDMKNDLSKIDETFSSKAPIEKVAATTDFIGKSVLPTLRRGKLNVWNVGSDGTATLHILVRKEIFDALLNKTNVNGMMGTYGNPYTRLRQIPMENGARFLITEAIRDTIGLGNINPESIRVTTIPMHVYIAKSLFNINNNKLFALIGDAAVGLIFIRGVNNGLQTTIAYASALYKIFKDFASHEKIKTHVFKDEIPQELLLCEETIKALFWKKVKEIKSEQAKIDILTSAIETSNASSSFLASWLSSDSGEMDELEELYDPSQAVHLKYLRDLLQEIDDELNKIQLEKNEEGLDIHEAYKSYRPWLPTLDLLANQFDENIYALEKKQSISESENNYLIKILTDTLSLIKNITSTTDKTQQLQFILNYKTQISQLGQQESDNDNSLLKGAYQSVRLMLDSFINNHFSSYHLLNKKRKIDHAALSVVNDGLSAFKL